MFPTWSDWDISYTRQGALKKRKMAVLRSVVLLGLVFGAWKLGKSGQNLATIKQILKSYVRRALLVGAGIMQIAGGKL
jgi:hypothetical protein